MHTNASGNWAHYDLHTDHLGSTVLTTNQGNAVVSNERYFAYGRTRYGGIGVTDQRFTAPKGPPKRDGTGLQYYNARYYDPRVPLGRGQFLSPDTLVPDPGTLFDYNRYLYTRGNPMWLTDSSDHIWQVNDTAGVVQAITVVARQQRMYNLTVAVAHPFFVGNGQWGVPYKKGRQALLSPSVS